MPEHLQAALEFHLHNDLNHDNLEYKQFVSDLVAALEGVDYE